MRCTLTVTATFDLARPGIVRTQLEPARGLHQRVTESATSCARSRGPSVVIDHPNGMRCTYLQLDEGPVTVIATSEVRTGTPAHLANRVPPIAWDQCAALTHAIRSTGQTGDGTEVVDALSVARASLPSGLVPVDDEDRDLAFTTLSPGQPLIVALAEIAQKVSELSLDDAAAAHRVIGAMRAVGIAAQCVVGVASDGQIRTWAAVNIPGFAWFHIDPQTAMPIDATSILLGWGRDAADLPLVSAAGASAPILRATVTEL